MFDPYKADYQLRRALRPAPVSPAQVDAAWAALAARLGAGGAVSDDDAADAPPPIFALLWLRTRGGAAARLVGRGVWWLLFDETRYERALRQRRTIKPMDVVRGATGRGMYACVM